MRRAIVFDPIGGATKLSIQGVERRLDALLKAGH
jgi:hypothetical protein